MREKCRKDGTSQINGMLLFPINIAKMCTRDQRSVLTLIAHNRSQQSWERKGIKNILLFVTRIAVLILSNVDQ